MTSPKDHNPTLNSELDKILGENCKSNPLAKVMVISKKTEVEKFSPGSEESNTKRNRQ